MEGVILWKAYESATYFYQNGMHKGNGLDLRAEPPRIKLCRVPSEEQEIHSKTFESRF